MRSILAICECIPFFMPISRRSLQDKICRFSDIPCLDKYKQKWINIYPDLDIEELEFERENSIKCSQCVPTCDYVAYSFSTNYASLVDTNDVFDM